MDNSNLSFSKIAVSLSLSALFISPICANADTTEWITQPYEAGGEHSTVVEPHGIINRDGRYVVFSSAATGLHPDKQYYGTSVFLYDRVKKRMEVISKTHDGSKPLRFNSNTCYSDDPSVSADGRYVVFTSNCDNIVAQGADPYYDIYLHDRATGTTRLLSTWTAGEFYADQISGNGRYITYTTTAKVSPADTNFELDLYLYDRQTGKNELITKGKDESPTDGFSGRSQISYDGRYIAFLSTATNLVDNDNNGRPDAFIYDRLNRKTELVSRAMYGETTGGGAIYRRVGLSDNGRFIAFESSSTDLVSRSTNSSVNIFMRDRQKGTTSIQNVTSDGEPSSDHGYAYLGGLSANGRYVTFSDSAPNLVDDYNNQSRNDVFIRDRVIGVTEVISVTEQNAPAWGFGFSNNISSNGQYVVFFSNGDLVGEGDDDDGQNKDLYVRAVSRMH